MPRAAADPGKLAGLASRLAAFVTERHPLAVAIALDVFDAVGGHKLKARDHAGLESLRGPFRRELARRLYDTLKAPEGTDHTTPGTTAARRMEQARSELVDACDGFLRRESIAASLTRDERVEMLRGMALTRAVDNRLKQFFMSGEIRWGGAAFQGKGFRSLGQEAIYAAGIRLKRGPKYRGEGGEWLGDVVAPVIRDVGVALAMRHDAEAVRGIFTAQMGKDGPPMHGKDLHTGDFAWGVLPATAPLAVGSLSVAGMAMAFWREGAQRVAVSFIGEGGSSLGEWHEAITVCAARKLPAVFCLENNQTALSTPVADNCAARVFADKAAGYWDAIIGPGKAIDTNKYFVFSSDTLVNLNTADPKVMTTGPASIDPDTGKPYGMNFPVVSLRDFIEVQKKLVDNLGIKKLVMVGGASMGGLQTYEWAGAYPDMVGRIMPVIAAGEADAGLIAWGDIWAAPIRLDPKWNGGDYYGNEPPLAGLAQALKLVTLHSQTSAWATATFGAKWAKEGDSPLKDLANRYAVDAALEAAGAGRAKSSDANSFLYLVRANQLFAEGAAERLKAIKAPALIIYSPTDLIFAADSVKRTAEAIKANGAIVELVALDGKRGHLDGVLSIKAAEKAIAAFVAK